MGLKPTMSVFRLKKGREDRSGVDGVTARSLKRTKSLILIDKPTDLMESISVYA